MPKLCAIPQSVEKLSNQAGVHVRRDSNGFFRVTTRADRTYVGQFRKPEEVKEFLSQLVDGNLKDLSEKFGLPLRGEATIASPTRVGEQLSPVREAWKTLQLGVFSAITPIEQIARNIETLGIGKALSKVYEPLQRGKVNANVVLTQTKHESLGGKTFNEAIHDLGEKVAALSPDERPLVTLHSESFTKEELVGMLEISDDDIALAENFLKLGVAEDIPILVRRSAIVDDFLKNRDKMLNETIPGLRNAILEGKLPQEFAVELDRLAASAGVEDTPLKVMQAMGLNENEIVAMNEIRRLVKAGSEAHNIPAIYRYATAPSQKAGFKNGREQFAAEWGMSPKAVAVSEERMKILETSFVAEGADAAKVLGVHLPVFRQFIDAGLYPGKQSGSANQYVKVLEGFEEGSRILTRRVLSGHLNPYELHPAVNANKHVRNMVLRQELDPLLPAAKAEIKNIAAVDSRPGEPSRLGRMLTEYMHEIEGLPSENFRAVTDKIRTMGRIAGIKIDDRFAERMTATLVRMTSQATIPFRVGLVVRNSLQSMFFTAPVMGGEAWAQGVKASLGWDGAKYSLDGMKSALKRAIKAGAIDPNVLPIHASDEIFGLEAAQGAAGLGPLASRAAFKVQDWFDMGFSFYRAPDDWGRVVAFEAGRFRVQKHMKNYLTSKRDAIALERFKIDSKVRTFDEAIEAQFDALVRAEEYDQAADLIGRKMADKAHMLYGNANHPPGWNSVPGRLFGQFGTFPVQYLNYVEQGLARGTVKDKFEWLTMHSALNMGVVAAGAELFDADLESWATIGSLTYTGGPYFEAMISTVQAWGGSDTEKTLAKRNLQMMFPTFDSPQSVFVPGSYFVGDLVDAFQSDDLVEGFLEGGGVRFLRAGEDTWVDKALGWIN